jgi:16S rRNA (cytosine1402-N4)-methyltransferase
VVGVDRDPKALAAATERLHRFAGPSTTALRASGQGERFRAIEGNYGDLPSLLASESLLPVDGILLDLGVSSPQLDDAARGFSFSKEGPLDMRMGSHGATAAERIAVASVDELFRVLKEEGEEPFAKPIARELKRALPQTTLEAAEAVKRAVPRKAWPKRIHVATRTFQALRIWVNDELGALDRFLAELPNLLRVGGRVCIISFHSLEDRRVKESFRTLVGRCVCPPGLPICACGAKGAFELLTTRAIKPSAEEEEGNPRARSARLRAAVRVR